MSISCAATRGPASRRSSSPSRTPRRQARCRTPGTRCARKSATSPTRCRPAFRDRTSTTSSATSTPISMRSKATASRRRSCMTTPSGCAPSCCACRTSTRSTSSAIRSSASTSRSRMRSSRSSASRRSRSRDAVDAQNAVAGAGVLHHGRRSGVRAAERPVQGRRRARDTLIRVNGRTFRLGDIATIKRGYADPPDRVHALRGHRPCSASA